MRLQSFKDTYLRSELIFAIDMILSMASSLLALYGVRFLVEGPLYTYRVLILYQTVSVVASVLLFFSLKTYRVILRHFDLKDTLQLILMDLVKCLVLFAAVSLAGFYSRPLVVIVFLDFFLTYALLLGFRFCIITGYEILIHKEQEGYNRRQVFLYGTSEKSIAAFKRLQNSIHYQVNGFLERSASEKKYLLDRLPVFCFDDEKKLDRIILEKKIEALIFCRDIDVRSESNGLIPYCLGHRIKTLIVPNVDEFVESKSFFSPRDIKIEDILNRKEIVVSLKEIEEFFSGKIVLITGAAGSIGSELTKQLALVGARKLILFDNGETAMHNLRLELEDQYKGVDFVPIIGDVRDPARLDFAFRTWHPQIVFHAAAYKHVPLMEENPCEAVLVNVYGTRNVTDKCVAYDVGKMVMISTDKAVNPTSVMGCTKRLAEIYVQSLGKAVEKGEVQGSTRFVTTRFGNVLGSNGSVVPRFRDQIAKGGPVTVTDPEISRFFMTIPEACRLVMEAAIMSGGNQIFAFDMGEAVKIDHLARRMIMLAGFIPEKEIKIEYTGLRPGEKLHEELLLNEEKIIPTSHERIMIAKAREYDFKTVEKEMEHLESLARQVDIPEVMKLMKEIVPEYTGSSNVFPDPAGCRLS